MNIEDSIRGIRKLKIGKALIIPEMHIENPLVYASYQGYSEISKEFSKLEAKNVELEKKLEIAVDFIKSVPDAHEHYGHELHSMCTEALAAIKGEGI